ncbi:MAG: hypothetical protein EZS28_010030 [Streblomastix strix]|uniref:Uncharacterized protein n=1 Tax=Streblomastix strix TaxID=222440 RepID=A0A5J4WIC8_9EUKA|nr:MAG: hypothetical protein EZS28_010030 [Streblomastix strix]
MMSEEDIETQLANYKRYKQNDDGTNFGPNSRPCSIVCASDMDKCDGLSVIISGTKTWDKTVLRNRRNFQAAIAICHIVISLEIDLILNSQ